MTTTQTHLADLVKVTDLKELVAIHDPRLAGKIEFSADGCWLWLGVLDGKGYGALVRGGVRRRAHRWVYELFAPIPEGLEMDHLCRVHRCVNPEHLEPVSHRENILRGESPMAQQARRTVCPQGHPLDADNTYEWRGHRRCKACNNMKSMEKYYRHRDRINAARRGRRKPC